MSAEQWDAFLEKIEFDTQLQEKLKEVTTPEAAITIAKAAGYSITADDIQAEEEDELSLEELGSVAGAGGRRLFRSGFFERRKKPRPRRKRRGWDNSQLGQIKLNGTKNTEEEITMPFRK